MVSIDFNLHKVFVEGSTDQKCIEKILELKYDILFPCNGISLDQSVINCGGWTKIKNHPAITDQLRINKGGKNLVIFDSDTKNNEGGHQKRYTQLISIANEMNVEFQIFLFPNNEQDGVLEDFYCSCFKKEMRFFEQCWNSLLTCFEQSNPHGLTLRSPGVYDKVYSYVDLFSEYRQEGYKNSKGKRDYFDAGLWEFNFETNNNLRKLIDFIEACGIITNI